MSRGGDILSLQIGNSANYVGGHIWNSRAEMRRYCGESTFAAGMYHSGSTDSYPRCVMIDSPDNLGQICPIDANVAKLSASSVWGGTVQNSMPTSSSGLSRTKVNVQEQASYHSKHGALFWSDFLKPSLHPKTVCQLPKWSTGDRFDLFHKGVVGGSRRGGSSVNDTITADFLDDALDRCRYFAEACDRLSTIEILTEHTGGIAGLTASLLEALREDYGNSICVPIWSLSGNTLPADIGLQTLEQMDTMKNKLAILDTALFHTQCAEYGASAMVPISRQQILASVYGPAEAAAAAAATRSKVQRQYDDYVYAAVAAAAIETISVYQLLPQDTLAAIAAARLSSSSSSSSSAVMQRYQQEQQKTMQQQLISSSSTRWLSAAADSSGSGSGSSGGGLTLPPSAAVVIENAHQWAATVTERGRYPVCFLEAGFPGILNSTDPSSNEPSFSSLLDQYSTLDKYVIDTFSIRDSRSSSQPLSAASSASSYRKTRSNPFTVPLSPVGHLTTKELSAEALGSAGFPYQKAFTNFISFRGTANNDLRESLYGQCLRYPYRISCCQLNATPLFVARSR